MLIVTLNQPATMYNTQTLAFGPFLTLDFPNTTGHYHHRSNGKAKPKSQTELITTGPVLLPQGFMSVPWTVKAMLRSCKNHKIFNKTGTTAHRFFQIGAIIFALHDASDVFMKAAKVFKYF
ncbi:hypothetical protein CUMW_164380 [Citrus unshiu]|uniref:Uncharacterized protein n=1 Tax=Citrus unshiu TaxID=55188 RepID=A0A2H5PSX0_CITUN|nr:hypothetical protein CUMW_164380 [Citrus unshiu]